MPTDSPTPDTLAAAIIELCNVTLALVNNRGQVAHIERDLRGRLSDLVRSLRPPPAAAAPSAAAEVYSGATGP